MRDLGLFFKMALRKVSAPLWIIFFLACLVGITAWLHDTDNIKQGIAGLIIPGERYADGWYGANFDAAVRACDSMGFDLRTKDAVGEKEEDLFAACDELLRMGARLIVLTGPDDPEKFYPYMRNHPYVQFSGFDLSISSPNYHPVFFRIYQARYLAGVLAGLMSRSHMLGFVAARPDPEVVRGINAFALGAQSVRPQTKVLVKWTGHWSDEKAEEQAVFDLKKAHADVISYHQHEEYVPRTAERLKINFIGMSMMLTGYSSRALTSVLCDWETYYRLLLRSLRDQSYVPPLWAGIDSGAVGLAPFSSRVPQSVRKKVNEVKADLISGKKRVFAGMIKDNQGMRHDFANGLDENSQALLRMNYLVEGVETLHGRSEEPATR